LDHTNDGVIKCERRDHHRRHNGGRGKTKRKQKNKKRKRGNIARNSGGTRNKKAQPQQQPHSDVSYQFVALDCEMVGYGRKGINSMLARCSLVTIDDDSGKVKVLYDTYVKPTKHVTDYRTQWSGVTKEHLESDAAVTFEVCRSKVRKLLNPSDIHTDDGDEGESKIVILVGHALKNDFQVLRYYHPRSLTRDTAMYKPFMRQVRKRMLPHKLSYLCEEHLGITIQNNDCTIEIDKDTHEEDDDETGDGHSSIEDAAATLLLYRHVSDEWEKSLGYPLQRQR